MKTLKNLWYRFLAWSGHYYSWTSYKDLPEAKLGYAIVIKYNNERVTEVLRAGMYGGVVKWHNRIETLTGGGYYRLMHVSKTKNLNRA